MSTDETKPPRLFTVEEANAMLPLVKSIARDLCDRSREVNELRERLALLDNRQRNDADVFSQEVTQIREEYQSRCEEIEALANELVELGIEPKNGPEGLVDFPSMMDGRIVYLCWKLGEPEVLHWHELDAGFAARQPLTAGSVSDGSIIGDESLGG